jgi:hypothetical protein
MRASGSGTGESMPAKRFIEQCSQNLASRHFRKIHKRQNGNTNASVPGEMRLAQSLVTRYGAALLENFLHHFGTVPSEYRDASGDGNAIDLADFGESH